MLFFGDVDISQNSPLNSGGHTQSQTHKPAALLLTHEPPFLHLSFEQFGSVELVVLSVEVETVVLVLVCMNTLWSILHSGVNVTSSIARNPVLLLPSFPSIIT